MNHHGPRGGERSGRNKGKSALRARKGSWVLIPSISIALASAFTPLGLTANATGNTVPIQDAGFEDGTLTGWSRGSQTGTLGASINGNGTGVTVFSGSRLFSHGARNAMGSPSSPYYAPAVAAGSWTFSPSNATYAALLQPKGEQTFTQATAALGLSGTQTSGITAMLSSQAQASGFGSGTPTDAAWITREVELTAGVTYTMSWNYMATDYVPFNDGSITSLVPVTVASTPAITVNNFEQSYALLGFSNPGTGDYSTNSFGSTGWQTSTYEVSVTGTYKLGFTVFNLDDTALSPVLMVDSEMGTTQMCSQNGACETFGGVAPNNDTAPTLPPTTTTEPAPTTTTTTLPPATSLEVTSLDDTASQGTLRWAIAQANAQSGGIYDSITFQSGLVGTITLTSDLPAITQSVSITGNGMASTVIDGNNLYRPIYNNGQRTIAISNMTLKNGKNATGGLAWANQGTFTVTSVKFSSTPNYAWYQQNQTVTIFNSSIFVDNYVGIRSDYGSTPTTKSSTDSDYQNRIYINNSQFLNNNYGLATERFVRINNSVFTNNSIAAAQLQGLNRQQVYSSTFTNNGTAVALFSYIPTSWTPGADNQLVEGNTFTGNGIAINVNNYFNNGTKIYNGVYANSWSTSRNNTFDDNNTIYAGSDFVEDSNTITTTTTTTTTTSTTTTTTSTTIVPTQTTSSTTPSTTEAPTTVAPPEETTTVEIPATAPSNNTTPIEIEAPIETPPSESYPEADGPAASVPQYAPEQETTTQTEEPPLVVPEATQDAADNAVADIFDGPMSNAGRANAVDDLVADAETPEALTAVVNSLLDQELTDTQFSTVINTLFDGPMADENFAAAVDAVFADTSALSDEQFDTAVQAVFDGPLSTEQFSDALESVFSEPLSDEKFDAIIDAVLDEPLTDEQFTEIVNVLESDTVSEEQVAAAVDQILESEVTADQATELATSDKVLESIDETQAAEIFDAISVNELTSTEEAALVAAVTDAPDEVKNAFEETIDIFAEGLDEYVALGSQVDVGTRRSLIAASAAVSTLTAAGAAGAASGGPSGGSNGNGSGNGSGNGGNSGNGNGNTEGRSKKEEEGEQEAAGEIAGPEEDEKKKPFTRNSIFKYQEN